MLLITVIIPMETGLTKVEKQAQPFVLAVVSTVCWQRGWHHWLTNTYNMIADIAIVVI